MNTQVGISERRLANRRFKKTEDAIMKVFFEDDGCVSAREIAKRVGVSRATVYVHHRAVKEIVPDYEKYILRQYRRMMHKILQVGSVQMKVVYIRMLGFIMMNKRIFKLLVRAQGERIFDKMLDELKDKLMTTMGLPKNSQTLIAVYKSEVARLLCEWERRGLKNEELGKVLMDIMYLTKTARERLKILLD